MSFIDSLLGGSISQYEKDKILKFIVNMKKTGQPVSEALIYYANTMAKKVEIKTAVSNVVDMINKGKDVEVALFEAKIIDEFQYSILKSSKNKNEAYDNVLSYKRDLRSADRFYLKNFSKALLSPIIISFGLPILIDIFTKIIENIRGFKQDFMPSPFVSAIIDFRDFFMPIGVILTALFVLGIVFYIYSYKENLPLHYRIFQLKAMSDSLAYFTMINDMLISGLKSYQIFAILGKYMHPKSSRNYFLKIRENLEKNQGIDKELKDLGTNDMAIFNIKMAKAMNDVPSGFKNALISIKDYIDKERQEYLDIVDFVTFALMVLPILAVFMFISFASIDIGMLD